MTQLKLCTNDNGEPCQKPIASITSEHTTAAAGVQFAVTIGGSTPNPGATLYGGRLQIKNAAGEVVQTHLVQPGPRNITLSDPGQYKLRLVTFDSCKDPATNASDPDILDIEVIDTYAARLSEQHINPNATLFG